MFSCRVQQKKAINGSGIFLKPGNIAADSGNFPIILGVWIFGGVLCILGALCFAELATMLPHTGGMYVYLRQASGKLVAFLFGWTELLFLRLASIGALAVAFVGSLTLAIGWDASALARPAMTRRVKIFGRIASTLRKVVCVMTRMERSADFRGLTGGRPGATDGSEQKLIVTSMPSPRQDVNRAGRNVETLKHQTGLALTHEPASVRPIASTPCNSNSQRLHQSQRVRFDPNSLR